MRRVLRTAEAGTGRQPCRPMSHTHHSAGRAALAPCVLQEHPLSNGTTRRGGPCAPKQPSTILTTSRLDAVKEPARLQEIGFEQTRVLEDEKVSHNSQVGAKVFEKLQKPLEVEGQHASALRFGDPRVQALLSVLLLFALQPEGVRNRQLRPLLAQCLGAAQNQITQAMISYDLRRLRLHGIIERIEATHRYRLTAAGMKTAFLYSRLYLRALRPALSNLHAQNQVPHPIQQTFHKLQCQIDSYYADKVAA